MRLKREHITPGRVVQVKQGHSLDLKGTCFSLGNTLTYIPVASCRSSVDRARSMASTWCASVSMVLSTKSFTATSFAIASAEQRLFE